MEGEIVNTQKNNEQKKREDETSAEREGSDTRPHTMQEATPGAPIIRSNTPRPFMYSTMTAIPPSQLPDELQTQGTEGAFSAFPTKPPSAPPLPEEPDDYSEMEERLYTLPTPNKIASPAHETQSFTWLFEYSLEMDSTLLNTPERLDGLALLYGPVVLKGYRLVLGEYEKNGYGMRTLATVVPDARPDAEVWGILYRVPRHVTQESGDEPALLEMVHTLPFSGVQAIHVVVHETYRNRALPCITYGCIDATSLPHFSSHGTQNSLDVYVRRLTSIAKQQKLPDAYIKKLAHMGIATSMPHTPATTEQRETAPSLPVVTIPKVEQHTEPLMLSVEKLEARPQVPQATSPLLSQVQRIPIEARSYRWFVAFALYLLCLLLMILAFAVVQGIGVANDILNEHFTLLSVPWLVLVYGLLGGCISSIVTLGRTPHPIDAPVFVIVTWFTRPFVGVVLALFAYLLLSSGLFIPAGTSGGQHEALFLLIGALAGVCEGWLFLRKR